MYYISIILVVVSIGLIFLGQPVKAQYEDVRCKCICPAASNANSTLPGRKIFIKSFHEPSHCKCENVVDNYRIESQPNFCQRCDCQWQRRNTATIKVVVMIVICIVSLLFLYMLFLLCLDPLLSRRQTAYVEQRNETEEASRPTGRAMDAGGEAETAGAGVFSRVRRKVLGVAGRQEKWKGTVSEQRRNIYDRHAMLN